jgi:RNA polymerase sigma factor (TIGR02999 family)
MSQTACSPDEITAMLKAWGDGDREALEALVPQVYDELRRQAHRYLRGERPNHTLQTSALINEAYLRLAGQRDVEWQNRTHFFGIAANIMRRVLVDYARTQQRVKRGGKEENLPLDLAVSIVAEMTNEQTRIDLILLNSALEKLEEIDERQARIVELRYFSGLTVEETAEVLDISEMTVKRDWNVAKAWLRREITSPKNPEKR